MADDTGTELKHMAGILKISSGRISPIYICGFVLIVMGIAWSLVFVLEDWSLNNFPVNLAAFFSITIAYTVFITRVIVDGHVRDFDKITGISGLSAAEALKLRNAFEKHGKLHTLTAIAVCIGLFHAYLGNGVFYRLVNGSSRYPYFEVWMTFLIILIWVLITQACAIFVKNLKLFAQIIRNTEINLLHTEELTVFLMTGIRSTLAFAGSYALFPLVTGFSFYQLIINPALLIFIPLVLVMILIPLLPLRKKIRDAKIRELKLINLAIEGDRKALKRSHIADNTENLNIIDLINYKKIIYRISEIPFNVPTAFRLFLYIIIPLLTWIAASLVDKIVVAILSK